jgi:hypothetical protein
MKGMFLRMTKDALMQISPNLHRAFQRMCKIHMPYRMPKGILFINKKHLKIQMKAKRKHPCPTYEVFLKYINH